MAKRVVKICNDCHKRKQSDRSTQYTTLVTEYLQNLSGIQTVITINLAITIGLIAAYIALLSTLDSQMQNLPYIQAIFVILPTIGLVGVITCIRTIVIQNEHSIAMRNELNNMEGELGYKKIKRPIYYKPIHITLFGFSIFWILFAMALTIGIANLNFWGSCSNILKYTFSISITVLGSGISVWISNRIYEYRSKYFENKFNNIR